MIRVAQARPIRFETRAKTKIYKSKTKNAKLNSSGVFHIFNCAVKNLQDYENGTIFGL